MAVTVREAHGPDVDGVDDGAIAHVLAVGVAIGVIVMFLITWGLAALSEPSHALAVAPAALWAGIVGGGFFGGVVAIGVELSREERRSR